MTLQLLLPAILVFVADQLTKRLVAGRLADGRSLSVGLGVEIRHVANAGGKPWPARKRVALLLLWGSVLAGILVVIQAGYFFAQPAAQVGLGAALGGAAGNLYDWLRRQAVIDFVDVGWWPVFNLADVGILLGVVGALCFIR